MMACPYGGFVPKIFLFTGENSYAIAREKARWTEEFTKKHGRENLLTIGSIGLKVGTLIDEISILPFLAEKRIVFVDGLPKFEPEECALIPRVIHPEVVVVFIDDRGQKKAGGGRRVQPKDLLAIAESVKEFPLLRGKQVEQWVQGIVRAGNGGIEVDALQRLLQDCGEEQTLLESELEKLLLRAGPRHITTADIDALVIPTDEGVVWRITDLLCTGKAEEALLYAVRFCERGGEPFALWAVLLNFVKNLSNVWALVHGGVSSSEDIARQAGLSPFALRTLVPYAKKVSRETMEALLEKTVQTDRDIKTGQLRATEEYTEEIESVIDVFILGARMTSMS